MAGLIHIYCGDGKGKSTAAIGLALRAAGAGKQVVFTQFFKDGSSSEIELLKHFANIHVMHAVTVRGFYRRMNDAEKAQASKDYTKLFQDAVAAAEHGDLLVLDEIISACNHGTVAEKFVEDFLCSKPSHLEVVLTGRNPSDTLLELADYVTEMRKIKHPFDRGITAREGIEY